MLTYSDSWSIKREVCLLCTAFRVKHAYMPFVSPTKSALMQRFCILLSFNAAPHWSQQFLFMIFYTLKIKLLLVVIVWATRLGPLRLTMGGHQFEELHWCLFIKRKIAPNFIVRNRLKPRCREGSRYRTKNSGHGLLFIAFLKSV